MSPAAPELCPAFSGLRGQADSLARGEVSARELVERSLGVAERTTSLNAFRCLRRDSARREADAADDRLRAGERGPLLGVPIAVKDDVDVAGESTSFGCAGAFPAKAVDAHMVGRLRQAGAVIVGKTNTPELGQWAVAESFDVVLTPTTAQPPFPVGAIDGLSGWQTNQRMVAACPYTWPWNVVGWPAISVPAGFTAAGAPIGAQLVGAEGAEALLISLAARLEAQERWHEYRPPNSVYAPESQS